jgi:serine/threonine protein kinase
MTWNTLRHPNVLALVGVTMTEQEFVMVSEWMENGNITTFLKTNINANRLDLVRFLLMNSFFTRYLHLRQSRSLGMSPEG